MALQRFSTRLAARPKGGVRVALPFDPATAWGSRLRFHVAGSVAGHRIRGEITNSHDGPALELGPSWCRDPRMVDGLMVDVELDLEGPAIPDDLATALADEPDARSFFEALPSFYRKNFVRAIEAAKRPETRARRLAAIAAALREGRREIGG